MLSAGDTELLCRVGPGTPMGEMMRRYWMPVGYTWELDRDAQPQRVRVLGEDLILWRDSNGTPSLVQQRVSTCPTGRPPAISRTRLRAPPIGERTSGASPGPTWARIRPTHRGFPNSSGGSFPKGR